MPDNNYSFGAKLLHRLALGSKVFPEISFDLEKAIYGRGLSGIGNGRHVFVSGLARAGTTILMRMFVETGLFSSLTYRDMPFILAPNLWAKITGLCELKKTAEERAHGDGILVDYDSPEALEEVFWRVFCGDKYINTQYLLPMKAESEMIENFQIFIALVLKRYGSMRYISKNNNNILRLSSIREAFPKAAILIPFRDPLQHAFSLLNQHERFTRQHASDNFSRDYMKWLVHHEFGSDHRPFVFSNNYEIVGDPTTVEYWLALWISIYEHLLGSFKRGELDCLFVSYELLCEKPNSVWRGLLKWVGVDSTRPLKINLKKARTENISSDRLRLVKAKEIYDELYQLSLVGLLL